jgi:hypothetical protein
VEARIATVTLDTNVFPAEALVARAGEAGLVVAAVTVTHREVEGSTLEEEAAALETVLETAVFGESRFEEAVCGSEADERCLDQALALLSNRSFPRQGNREALTNGQLRQLRDAMILCAHIRSGRDLLVSNDRRGFVSEGRREAIAGIFGVPVMTVPEFEAYLTGLERRPAV